MISPKRRFLIAKARTTLAAACLLGLTHCGGGATPLTASTEPQGGGAGSGGGGVGGSGGAGPGSCGPLSTPAGRPAAVACAATSNGAPDAGIVTCITAADCPASPPFAAICLHGVCGRDECLGDGDCAPGRTCLCGATKGGGNGLHTNTCAVSECRVDADCGPGGVCSAATAQSACGGTIGYFCRTPQDTCGTSADCCDHAKPACNYGAEVGHWTCQAVLLCNG